MAGGGATGAAGAAAGAAGAAGAGWLSDALRLHAVSETAIAATARILARAKVIECNVRGESGLTAPINTEAPQPDQLIRQDASKTHARCRLTAPVRALPVRPLRPVLPARHPLLERQARLALAPAPVPEPEPLWWILEPVRWREPGCSDCIRSAARLQPKAATH